jgi:hypothetical protein
MNTENSVVPRNSAFALDQCIAAAWKPLDIPTDWDAVIANAGDLDVEAMTAELKAGEPWPNNELNKLRVFRLQTKILIGLRHTRGLPQYSEHVCPDCGTRKAYPVRMGWRSYCLPCVEAPYLIPFSNRYRTSTRPMFDTTTNRWGIAYIREETSHDGGKTGAIIVSGFENREEAVIADAAPFRFWQLFNRVVPAGQQCDWGTVFPVGDLFRQRLPMTPDGWRAWLEGNMRQAQTEESEPFEGVIRDVAKEYFRERR